MGLYVMVLSFVGHFFAPQGEKMTYKGEEILACVSPMYVLFHPQGEKVYTMEW
jgi:hypothetical protein